MPLCLVSDTNTVELKVPFTQQVFLELVSLFEKEDDDEEEEKEKEEEIKR